MSTDRKEYQRQYYLKNKTKKRKPYALELGGCIVTYLLSILISVDTFQHFSTGLNSSQTWIFFSAVESLIFFLSFNNSTQKVLKLSTAVLLTLGLNFIISKGAYDDANMQKKMLKDVEKESTLLKETIQQLDSSIQGFQQREMHTKAVELLEKKSGLLKKLQSLTNKDQCNPENQIALIVMRLVISLLNIAVVHRMGHLLPRIFY